MKTKKTTSVIILFSLIMCLTAYAGTVPEPKRILGFEVGADYHLATYIQAMDYFKVLAENSDRIKLFDAGKTSMGQVMTYAVISSPQNLAELEKYKSIAKKLSLAQLPSAESARKLAQEGRAVVYIDGGLHASECAPAQHNIQLAYDLLTADDTQSLRILDDVILVLVFANPDGMNLLADWYHPNVGTPYEVSPMPWLYHIYAGHDNNRDSYIANLVETQNLTRLINQEWFPVILYNHHQTAPFPARIWTPPNSEPTNPNVHPLVVRWQNLIGSAMGEAFDAQGKEGAISRMIFDTWYPGYVTQVVDSHNVISILTETALYRYATPHFYTIRDFPSEYRDLTMSAFYPNPWKGGWWRIKDAVDYCLTASMAVLDTASRYRQELLFNKYKMGRDVIDRFKKEPPYAYIIPEKQHDPGTASLLLNRMILLGIDVFRSKDEFMCDGLTYPKGTYVIPLSQPFGLFIKNMFEEQKYPDLRKYPTLWQGIVRPIDFEGAPFESYDQMGWTLPYQFGVNMKTANTLPEYDLSLVREVRFQKGRVSGRPGYAYVLSHAENASFIAMNRILAAGGSVLWAEETFSFRNDSYPPGTILIPVKGLNHTLMEKIADELDLVITGISGRPKVNLREIRKTRLGLYKPWTANADEGWTRFLLEKYEFPFSNIHDADIRAGNLNLNFDVIIIPNSRRADSIVNGHLKGTLPPKYVGGITPNGVRNLKIFAEEGGILIFLNSSCNLAISSFRLPVRNVLENIKKEKFICDGSLLRNEFNPSHPLAFGMPETGAVVFENSCAFEILPSFKEKEEIKSAAKFPGESLLMSGWLFGGEKIRNKSTVLDVPLKKGKVILLGIPVQYRAQPYGTFKLLFNAVLFH